MVFDARLDDPESGGKVDAVVAEVGIQGESCAFRLAQRYRPKGFLRRFRRLGDIVVFERVENLLG